MILLAALAATALNIISMIYSTWSFGLYVLHRQKAKAKRRGAGVHYPDAPPLHWVREHMRWPSLAAMLPAGAASHVLMLMQGKPEPWGWDDWALLVALLAAWWFVQRWQDNHDCTCDDDRHRRRSEAASKVAAVDGKLVIVPAT